MNHQNQYEQEESQLAGRINKYSNTMYYISFLFGLLIIITGYILIKAIFDYVGMWATILIIAIISILVARKL